MQKTGEMIGEGTGDLYEHLENLKNTKISIFILGISAKSKGNNETLLDGYKGDFEMVDLLDDETIKVDTVLSF